MSAPEELLTPSQRERWAEWNRLRALGLRREAAAQLGAFVDDLKSSAPDDVASWVAALCASRLDVASELDGPAPSLEPMPHPLFIEVVLPVLVARRDRAATPWPRWLAQAESQVWRSSTAALAQLGDEHDAVTLLRAAVAARPDDRLARLELARQLWSRLRYAVHEVPRGLLLDPAPMRANLDELEIQLRALQFPEPRWPLLTEWRRFADVWERYVAQQPKTRTYAAMLAE